MAQKSGNTAAAAKKKPDNAKKGPSEAEQKKEASKAAQQSLKLENEARELTKAAAGAGDPEERQKLLNQALEKEIRAESFGKTAKWLQSGGFQGFLAGSAIGVGFGAGLGTIVGTLVGGLTSVLTGGITGGIGAAAGAIHGPMVNIAELAGSGIRKVTGDIPGWKATSEEKKALEDMIGDINEQDRPSRDELEAVSSGSGGGSEGGKQPYEGSWTQKVASYVPTADSIPSFSESQEKKKDQSQQRAEEKKPKKEGRSQDMPKQKPSMTPAQKQPAKQEPVKPEPAKPERAKPESAKPESAKPEPATPEPATPKKRPAKLPNQTRSSATPPRRESGAAATSSPASPTGGQKKKPRKLEVRSANTAAKDNSRPAAGKSKKKAG